MNRRGFITAILAVPLVPLGIFAGNHNAEGSRVELGASAKPYYDAVKDFKGPTALWTNLHGDWTYIEFGDGRVVRNERWHGKKLPFAHTGGGIHEAKLAAGDLCG